MSQHIFRIVMWFKQFNKNNNNQTITKTNGSSCISKKNCLLKETLNQKKNNESAFFN
jgi:hypothetical protein